MPVESAQSGWTNSASTENLSNGANQDSFPRAQRRSLEPGSPAQRIAGHVDSRTTKLYDRRGQKVLLEDMERIRY
jgi:hypothetical protein